MTIRELKEEDRRPFEQLYITCFRSFLPQLNDQQIAEQGWNKAKQYIQPFELEGEETDLVPDESHGGIIYRSFAAYRSLTPNGQPTLIGCLLLRSYTTPDLDRKLDNTSMIEPYAYVQVLIVGPEARRQGVARTLMGPAEVYARARRCTKMSLYTFPNLEAAVALYRSLGYTLVEADKEVKVPPGQEGRQLWIKELV